MIAGLHKGDHFGPLLRYLFHGKGGAQHNRGTLLGGTVGLEDPHAIQDYLEHLQRLRPDVMHPVHHLHVSLPPGETLTTDQWLHTAKTMATVMRWGHWVAIAHHDTDCQHIHIVGTRLSEGRVYPERLRDHRLIMRQLRKLEIELRLRRVDNPTAPRTKHARARQDRRTPNRERAMARAGKQSNKQKLRETLDAVIAEGFRQGGVMLEMNRRGYAPYTTWKEGHPVGICWTEIATGKRITGARLGPEYAGRRFFQRIGGLYGEATTPFDPSKIRPYDCDRAWRRITRELRQRSRPQDR